MRHKTLRMLAGFRVVYTNRRAQVAEMVLRPGASEGDPGNRHKGADQWLYVVSGRGAATINDRRIGLAAGTLVLIEKKDRHELTNTGRTLLKTLNFYSPPAYRSDGSELPRGHRS